MANIKSLRRDMAKVNEGEWRRLYLADDADDDAWLYTKGISASYQDVQTRKLNNAAKSFNGQVSKIPTALAHKVEVETAIEALFRNIRNLQLEEGGPDLTFAEFCDAIRDPAYRQLYQLAMAAAAAVGSENEEMTAEAAGN